MAVLSVVAICTAVLLIPTASESEGHAEATISAYKAKVREEENIIATRLAGTWQADADLTKHFGGDAEGRITFENDPDATERMPGWLVELIRKEDKQVYLAGVAHLPNRRHDFVLTEKNGVPAILLFDKDTPDLATAPLGHIHFASPLEVMMAAAKNKDNDMLIVRGPAYFTHHYPVGAFRRAMDARNTKDSND